jgi:hypothetical protein
MFGVGPFVVVGPGLAVSIGPRLAARSPPPSPAPQVLVDVCVWEPWAPCLRPLELAERKFFLSIVCSVMVLASFQLNDSTLGDVMRIRLAGGLFRVTMYTCNLRF